MFEKHPMITIVAFLAFVTIFLSILTEVMFRYISPQWIPRESRSIYEDDHYLGWTFAKDFQKQTRDPFNEKDVFLQFNSDGFRGRRVLVDSVIENQKKILFIGDSVTAAIQVEEDERFSNLIGGNFKKTTSINLGVNGYSTDQIIMTLKKYIGWVEPALVVYTFVNNDLWPLAMDRFKLDDIEYGKPMLNDNLEYVKRPFSKRGIGSADNGISVFKRIRMFLKEHFALFNFLSQGNLWKLWKESFSDGGVSMISPNDRIMQQVTEWYQPTEAQYKLWKKMEIMMIYMNKLVEASGAKLIVVPYIDLELVNDDIASRLLKRSAAKNGTQLSFMFPIDMMRQICRKNDIDFVDVDVKRMKEYQQNHGPLHYVRDNVIYDGHLTPEGHRYYARIITEYIKDRDYLH
jgi:hypothetical protein